MNSKNATQIIITSLAIGAAAGTSSADIMSSSPTVTVAPGTVMTADLTHDAFESDSAVRLYSERTGYTLQSLLKLDVTATGSGGASNLSIGNLAAGEELKSYFLHFDPESSSSTSITGGFQLTSDEQIVGLIFTDAYMSAADNIIGRPGVTYPSSFASRGYDANNDLWSISADRRTFQFQMQAGGSGLDQVRVITQSVPAPGALALSGLGALLIAKRRRK